MKLITIFSAAALAHCFWFPPSQEACADVKLPSIFGSHMVLQRDRRCPVWGTAASGEKVQVAIGGQAKSVTAGADGKWRVTLDPLTSGEPHTMTVSGKNTIVFQDVLVGEVWLCSGQSNMQWSVSQSKDADLEILAAKYPYIRHITVPHMGVQQPQEDFDGQWQTCSPETIGSFSAVGYFFGLQLFHTLDVPVGLIDNAWGGSACEAWVRRDLLSADPRYQPMLERWDDIEEAFSKEKAAQAQGRADSTKLKQLTQQMGGQHRPSNLYCGVLHPIVPYGIRGAIWYQGETNAHRAYQYRHLFPLMIQSWRDEWDKGDFPFYWVQLADWRAEPVEPGGSAWAELREAQTMTLNKLPNTGEAVILNLGEGRDIHPRNKQEVGLRLARWALAHDYGYAELAHQSPTLKSMQLEGGGVHLTIDYVGAGLYTFDVSKPIGFTIAGADRSFSIAEAKLVGKDQIEVWSEKVPQPVAVRYAWADNPICNVYSRNGLPLTPFRTDDWPGITEDNH